MLGAAAVAAMVTVSACGNSGSSQAVSATPAVTTSTSVAADAHNQADMMFAHHMIPHHQQAIEMSDMLLDKQGIDPRVVDLAQQIKAAQGPEIETMKGWLTQWGMSGSMPAMNGMNGMDGMMSSADMDALHNAQGVAAAKLYLTQMITHHQGAIKMAQSEITDGQNAAAVALARSIVTDQQREIDTMNQILATL